jgi:hypothetical protein
MLAFLEYKDDSTSLHTGALALKDPNCLKEMKWESME